MRALIVALSLALATPVIAQTADEVSGSIETIFGDAKSFEAAFTSIQGAVRDRDAAAVAGWVEYPITVNPGTGDELVVENAEDFVAHYDDIVTDDVFSAVDGQAYGDLFVNADGVMFGDGQMWISGICQNDACSGFDIRIITIQSTAE